MKKLDVTLVHREERMIYGLSMNSSDKTQPKDIDSLSRQFHEMLELASEEVLPFYVVSEGYDPGTGECALFVGGEMNHMSLTEKLIPAGEYGVITVRPKLGFLWGSAIGEAKRYFYTQWIEERGRKPKSMEFEMHTRQSISKNPSIYLYFSIE